jgi:hypothetical protein
VLIARCVHLQQIYVRCPKPVIEYAYKGIIMPCAYQNMPETVFLIATFTEQIVS